MQQSTSFSTPMLRLPPSMPPAPSQCSLRSAAVTLTIFYAIVIALISRGFATAAAAATSTQPTIPTSSSLAPSDVVAAHNALMSGADGAGYNISYNTFGSSATLPDLGWSSTEMPVAKEEDAQSWYSLVSEVLEKYYSLVLLVFGTVGNLLCFGVLYRKTFRRTTIGIFLRFLTLCDLGALWTGVLYFAAKSIFSVNVRESSEQACKIHRWLSYVCCDLGSWALILVSSARLVSILKPMNHTITRCRAYAAIMATCVLALGVNLPIYIMYGDHYDPDRGRMYRCTILTSSYRYFIVYVWTWIVLVKFAVLPGIVLLALNAVLIGHVYRSRKIIQDMQRSSDNKNLRNKDLYDSGREDGSSCGKRLQMFCYSCFSRRGECQVTKDAVVDKDRHVWSRELTERISFSRWRRRAHWKKSDSKEEASGTSGSYKTHLVKSWNRGHKKDDQEKILKTSTLENDGNHQGALFATGDHNDKLMGLDDEANQLTARLLGDKLRPHEDSHYYPSSMDLTYRSSASNSPKMENNLDLKDQGHVTIGRVGSRTAKGEDDKPSSHAPYSNHLEHVTQQCPDRPYALHALRGKTKSCPDVSNCFGKRNNLISKGCYYVTQGKAKQKYLVRDTTNGTFMKAKLRQDVANLYLPKSSKIHDFKNSNLPQPICEDSRVTRALSAEQLLVEYRQCFMRDSELHVHPQGKNATPQTPCHSHGYGQTQRPDFNVISSKTHDSVQTKRSNFCNNAKKSTEDSMSVCSSSGQFFSCAEDVSSLLEKDNATDSCSHSSDKINNHLNCELETCVESCNNVQADPDLLQEAIKKIANADMTKNYSQTKDLQLSKPDNLKPPLVSLGVNKNAETDLGFGSNKASVGNYLEISTNLSRLSLGEPARSKEVPESRNCPQVRSAGPSPKKTFGATGLRIDNVLKIMGAKDDREGSKCSIFNINITRCSSASDVTALNDLSIHKSSDLNQDTEAIIGSKSKSDLDISSYNCLDADDAILGISKKEKGAVTLIGVTRKMLPSSNHDARQLPSQPDLTVSLGSLTRISLGSASSLTVAPTSAFTSAENLASTAHRSSHYRHSNGTRNSSFLAPTSSCTNPAAYRRESRKRRAKKKLRGTQSSSLFPKNSGRPKNLTRTLLVINSVFLICNIPIVIYLTGKTYFFPGGYDDRQDLFNTSSNFIMYTNNALNFLLYCLTGTRFRHQLRAMFKDAGLMARSSLRNPPWRRGV